MRPFIRHTVGGARAADGDAGRQKVAQRWQTVDQGSRQWRRVADDDAEAADGWDG